MRLIITPSRRPYVVFTIICLPIVLLCLAAYFKTHDVDLLLMGGTFLAALGALWLWTAFYKIELTDDRITVGWPGLLTWSLDRDEIGGWYTAIGFRDRHGRTGPFVRLVVEPKPSCAKRAIVLPLKLFDPKDIKLLTDYLSKRDAGPGL